MSGREDSHLRTPQSFGEHTKQGYSAIYELDLMLDDALDYVSNPSNFLSVHDGIVRELHRLGDTGSADDLFAAFLRRVKDSNVKISQFTCRTSEQSKSHKWFYRSIDSKDDYLPSRSDAIKLCFAFKLNVEDAADFLWKVCKLNGFCFRRADDIIYCYCLANGLEYAMTKEIKGIYNAFAPPITPSDFPHITRTRTLYNVFGNLRGIKHDDFIRMLCANKHNFIGYSKTAHAEMVAVLEEVKEQIQKERAIDSRSAWLTEQIEVRQKNKQGFEEVAYKTAKLSANGKLRIVDGNEIIETNGDDDEFTYAFICKQLLERQTLPSSSDVAIRKVPPIKAMCFYVSNLVSFLTESNLEKVIQNENRATEMEYGCARKIFVFLKFAQYVLDWESFLYGAAAQDEPVKFNAGSGEEKDEFIEDFYIALNDALDRCGYGYLYYANPFDWHVLNCVRLLDTNNDDTRRALIQFNEILGQMTEQ
jgi:hypothetical protein